ncbi:McrB family protein [Veillonella sp.]|uniref:McrB family protein n=1 Tax=Veillonella sp. TaxID=1926307 RepID=UPI00258ACB2C|nr:AAA family ATPase [Veillonella sp.]MDU4572911.1 AAA family ATPase [Veillonella sp.]
MSNFNVVTSTSSETFSSNSNTRIVALPKTIKDIAKILIKTLEEIDKFKRISHLFIINDNNIKIDTSNLGGNFLGFVFARAHAKNYNTEGKTKTRKRTRVFDDYDFYIEINGSVEKCRLSTEWVGTTLDDPKQNANYVYALINIINKLYSDVLNVFKSDGKWYLEKMSNLNITADSFTFENLLEPFDTTFAKRYISSLMAKPFVILTGNSGTGKTRIATLFAKFLEVKLGECEKNWILVPVGADWTDNTKILGFYNPLADNGKGKYEKSSILRLIELANLPENKDIPFFIILDEMNLSHVERYFADFLSHMETPEFDFILDGYSGSLKYPKNLFIVGTVNIDETTYMFSPKVLDRANVIEFIPEKESVLDLFKTPLNSKNNILVAHSNFAKLFLNKSLDIRNGYSKLNDDIILELQGIFSTLYDLLEKCGYEFSYRTVREIRQYISAAYELTINESDFNLNSVLDEAIIQKILPKIHGSRREIGELLDELEKFCSDKKLELSFKKIQKMKGKFAKVQYASFI